MELATSEKHRMQIVGVACDHVTSAEEKLRARPQLQSHLLCLLSSGTRFVRRTTTTGIFHLQIKLKAAKSLKLSDLFIGSALVERQTTTDALH